MKTETQNNITSNNLKVFDEVIIPYLPKHYVKKVQKIVPEATEEQVRVVKHRKAGSPIIINALIRVAKENKQLLNL